MAFFKEYVIGILVPVLLIGTGIFFIFYLKFFFIVKPKKLLSCFIKKEKGEGSSPFEALTVALAGTLGVGNIVGVASAIILGGPGAVFWMWVSALCATVVKYAEIVVAHRYRRGGGQSVYGGAMYYIEDFYKGKTGRFLGAVFALFCVLNSLSMGCMLQANAVTNSFREILDINPILIGVILSIIVAVVVFRNIHNIAPLTSLIIPIMTIVYIIASLAVILRFREGLPYVFSLIFRDAFSFSSATGGVLGFLLSGQIRYGVMRGLLSNEAGCGTAPIAHATTRAKYAAEQGVWGIVEVFVDTIFLCTVTAVSILLVFGNGIGDFSPGEEMKLVILSYQAALGGVAGPLMSLMIFLFAFATIICWAYYGGQTLKYLTRNKKILEAYKIFYVLSVLIGAISIGGFVWDLSDLALGVMTLVNLITLILMRKEVRAETEKLF